MAIFERLMETGRAALRQASERVLEPVQRAVSQSTELQVTQDAPLQQVEEPPVVARLMVEIRSDGSHTIARGALEDVATGQKVAIRADGTSPAQLARALAGTLITLPAFATRIARSLKRGETEDSLEPPKRS